jgi:hypothetical protein
MADEAIEPEVVGEAQAAQPASQDPTQAMMTVLEAIRSGSADPQKMVVDLLGSQAGASPETGMLLKLLGENEEKGSDELREEVRAEILEEQAEAIGGLETAAERLLAENRDLQRRLDALAAAIGACPACFGEDLLCETCAGAGAPGSRLPQAGEFHNYVSPALARVSAALRRPRPRRPWPRTPGANPAISETAARAGARP